MKKKYDYLIEEVIKENKNNITEEEKKNIEKILSQMIFLKPEIKIDENFKENLKIELKNKIKELNSYKKNNYLKNIYYLISFLGVSFLFIIVIIHLDIFNKKPNFISFNTNKITPTEESNSENAPLPLLKSEKSGAEENSSENAPLPLLKSEKSGAEEGKNLNLMQSKKPDNNIKLKMNTFMGEKKERISELLTNKNYIAYDLKIKDKNNFNNKTKEKYNIQINGNNVNLISKIHNEENGKIKKYNIKEIKKILHEGLKELGIDNRYFSKINEKNIHKKNNLYSTKLNLKINGEKIFDTDFNNIKIKITFDLDKNEIYEYNGIIIEKITKNNDIVEKEAKNIKNIIHLLYKNIDYNDYKISIKYVLKNYTISPILILENQKKDEIIKINLLKENYIYDKNNIIIGIK